MNKKLSLQDLNRLSVDAFKAADKHPIIVILDNIRSMHNVGAFFRTADAFKLEKIILGGFTPQPPHRDIHKTAIGATDTVKWEHAKDLLPVIEGLKKDGYVSYAIEQTEQSMSLEHLDINPETDKICLIFGNEVGGVDQRLIDVCDYSIEIPQFGTKHSLNVSVCAGICMWEFTKPYLNEK